MGVAGGWVGGNWAGGGSWERGAAPRGCALVLVVCGCLGECMCVADIALTCVLTWR